MTFGCCQAAASGAVGKVLKKNPKKKSGGVGGGVGVGAAVLLKVCSTRHSY